MSQPAIDLTSELLRGMRLSGVNYRRIETARPFGVGFSAVAGKAQFHFISRGPRWSMWRSCPAKRCAAR